MKELIHANWRPSTKTINALKNGGWSDEQRKRILIAFIQDERYWNKEIEGASSLYNAWVRFETPRDAKAKPNGAKKIIEKRATDLENKSEDGAERAQEAKNCESDVRAMAAMINRRWDTTSAEEAIKLFGE